MKSCRQVAPRRIAHLGALAATALVASSAHAALVEGSLANTYTNEMFPVANSNGSAGPNRQMIVSNVDLIDQVRVVVTGPMTSGTGKVTVQLRDGCGAALGGVSSGTYDSSGISTAGSSKWVTVNVPRVAVPYGNYMFLDVTSSVAPLVRNVDGYGGGRLYGPGQGELSYPAKKQDLMFSLHGFRDSSKPVVSMPTTNRVCPAKCVLANPGGVEISSWGITNQLNVIIRERTGASVSTSKGSFWSDKAVDGGISLLQTEIAHMLQAGNGLQNVYPYNGYYVDNNSPTYNAMYYPNMNFYIAIEDPNQDVQEANAFARGFNWCANIDVGINVVTGKNAYGAVPGSFQGDVNRPAANTSNWGDGMASTLVHEVWGHGVAALWDEYVSTTPQATYDHVVLAKDRYGFMANALPLTSTACNEWCSGTQNVNWLISQMRTAADRDAPCWGFTTQAQCSPSTPPTYTMPTCRWIGGLTSISYWGSNKCIPENAANYDIGIGCASTGNDGCYPLAPISDAGSIMDVVQPNASIMESTHTHTPAPGFGTHVEDYIKDVLDCAFNPIPCAATNTNRCNVLIARYGSGGTPTAFIQFLKDAKTCDTTGVILRR